MECRGTDEEPLPDDLDLLLMLCSITHTCVTRLILCPSYLYRLWKIRFHWISILQGRFDICFVPHCRIPCYLSRLYFNGLMQERRNSSALALELRLPCINPSILSADARPTEKPPAHPPSVGEKPTAATRPGNVIEILQLCLLNFVHGIWTSVCISYQYMSEFRSQGDVQLKAGKNLLGYFSWIVNQATP